MNTFIKREYDYAIRICAYLAGQKKSEPIPLSQIAKKLQLTKPFTTKIMHQLKKGGITESVQAKTGGVFLAREATKLSLLEILKSMNFNSTLNECVSDHDHCPLVGFCQIHQFFNQTEVKLLEIFATKMISELIISDIDLT